MRHVLCAAQMVTTDLSFDRHTFGMNESSVLTGSCLRNADPTTWRNAFTFGRVCAARMDFKNLPHDLLPHPWDAWLPDDLKNEPTEGSSGSEGGGEL